MRMKVRDDGRSLFDVPLDSQMAEVLKKIPPLKYDIDHGQVRFYSSFNDYVPVDEIPEDYQKMMKQIEEDGVVVFGIIESYFEVNTNARIIMGEHSKTHEDVVNHLTKIKYPLESVNKHVCYLTQGIAPRYADVFDYKPGIIGAWCYVDAIEMNGNPYTFEAGTTQLKCKIDSNNPNNSPIVRVF